MTPLTTVVIGAGNVATHLAPALQATGQVTVTQVFSRTMQSAAALASRLGQAHPVTDTDAIDSSAQLYVVSLPDDAALEVICNIEAHGGIGTGALWVHTSGSLPHTALSGISGRTGVFYPLQTFSRQVAVDMSRVPLFIEAAHPADQSRLMALGSAISGSVHLADGDLRRRMHVAAVFACNFTNYMFTVADDLLRADGLTLEVLHPLIAETMRKAVNAPSPADGQTGPAVRGDMNIVHAHASLLPHPLADIYTTLSQAIYHRHRTTPQQ